MMAWNDLQILQLLAYLDSLKLINAYRENLLEREKAVRLKGAFVWSATKQGHTFWRNRYDRFNEIIDSDHASFIMDAVTEKE